MAPLGNTHGQESNIGRGKFQYYPFHQLGPLGRVSLVVKKNPTSGATWRVMLEKIRIPMHCVEGKLYQRTTQRNKVKGVKGVKGVESISMYSVWQRNYIKEPLKEKHEESG